MAPPSHSSPRARTSPGPSLTESASRRRLLIRWNSDEVSIEGDSPVHGGGVIASDQPARLWPCTHDAEVPPVVLRLVIKKMDGLHLTRMQDRQEKIALGGHVLDRDDEPIRRRRCDSHAIDRPPRQ